jgi:hypothetical protein
MIEGGRGGRGGANAWAIRLYALATCPLLALRNRRHVGRDLVSKLSILLKETSRKSSFSRPAKPCTCLIELWEAARNSRFGSTDRDAMLVSRLCCRYRCVTLGNELSTFKARVARRRRSKCRCVRFLTYVSLRSHTESFEIDLGRCTT